MYGLMETVTKHSCFDLFLDRSLEGNCNYTFTFTRQHFKPTPTALELKYIVAADPYDQYNSTEGLELSPPPTDSLQAMYASKTTDEQANLKYVGLKRPFRYSIY